eukprot:4644597-Alexandrium_andersonii.AAC.1
MPSSPPGFVTTAPSDQGRRCDIDSPRSSTPKAGWWASSCGNASMKDSMAPSPGRGTTLQRTGSSFQIAGLSWATLTQLSTLARILRTWLLAHCLT